MISFMADYLVGGHPAILQRLAETNMVSVEPYGFDQYRDSAEAKIRKAIDCPDAKVWFLVGGTQCNQMVINMTLKSYEGVVAAKTAHVATHEAGAIENTGHKVMELPAVNGKLQAETLDQYLTVVMADGNYTHMVHPGMVYISQPTELGTLYSKAELTAIYETCQRHGIKLYIDGARLGTALGSKYNDVSLPEFARLCDCFYIGGNKCGAMIGEALVYPKGDIPEDFFTIFKQKGAVVAKSRMISTQFDVLFEDGLYEKLGRNCCAMAELLVEGLKAKGYQMWIESPTNQQFVVLENGRAQELLDNGVPFAFFDRYDDTHTVMRFCTCWATTKEDVEELLAML